MSNMYQKCPICNGSGKTHNNLSSSSYNVCKTCNGKTIISELTGLPPNGLGSIDYKDLKSTDFRDNCEQFENK